MLKLLLPLGRAWWLFRDKMLTRFVEGLTGLLADVRSYVDKIWLDTQPGDTRELARWDEIFGLDFTGLSDKEKRERLRAEWEALGGQSLLYIQGVLRAAGFDAYLHEWWLPGTNPPIARNPTGTFSAVWVQCGRAGAQCDRDGVQCGGLSAPAGTGYYLINKLARDGGVQPAPPDPSQWPFVLYVSGMSVGSPASIPAARRAEFETLLQRIKPSQQWLGLYIIYT